MSSPELADEKILSRLCKQIETSKWATTYLFTGKELTRKRELAILFAKALNCLSTVSTVPLPKVQGSGIYREGKEPCTFGRGTGFVCTSCRKISAGNHPDIKWYGVTEDKKTIRIGEVRDFKNWLNLKPYEAKVKVFIFDQAETLTAEAQNALLKSIEEPPAGNAIIFLVPNSKSLFDTIASRSVEIKVPPFPSEAIRSILIQEGVPKDEADYFARMAQGELSLAKQAREEGWFQKKNLWIDALHRDPVAFLDTFHSASRDEAAKVYAFLIEFIRDLLVFQASEAEELLINVDRKALIQLITSRHSFDSTLELLESVNRIRKSLDDYANQKLALTETEVVLERYLKHG